MCKSIKEILKNGENIINELMIISDELNGESLLEIDTYYDGGIFEDEDLEEVLIKLNLTIIDKNVKTPQEIKEKIKESLSFVQEEIKFAKFYNEKENIYITVPYVDINNRFDDSYANETIYFFENYIA